MFKKIKEYLRWYAQMMVACGPFLSMRNWHM